jgi:hypothetical protein
MTRLFEELMTGLEEADAFLAGETAGYKANSSAESDPRNKEGQLAEEAATTTVEELRPRRR